ncbi:DUF397 domain-containing protein [Streptomyces sp. NPDC059568]|uniref:DUF397 domain-containing protein n=1 Tax=Streptomyces sp. NPDC059568 TaxID=3346868 RepID=UPI0036B4A13D
MRKASELRNARWRKSSYSNTNGGACVEITEDFPGVVPVRDSKTPHGPALIIPVDPWTTFITSLKAQSQI